MSPWVTSERHSRNVRPAHKLVITGKQLTDIFRYTLAPEKRKRAIFQVNKSIKVVYNDTLQDVESLTVHDVPVEDDKHGSICLQDYYYKNSEAKLAIAQDALGRSQHLGGGKWIDKLSILWYPTSSKLISTLELKACHLT